MQNGSSHIEREQTLPQENHSKVSLWLITLHSRRFGTSLGLFIFQAGPKESPLFVAVFAGDDRIVESLLAAGADRNIKDPKVCAISSTTVVNAQNILVANGSHPGTHLNENCIGGNQVCTFDLGQASQYNLSSNICQCVLFGTFLIVTYIHRTT